MASPTLPAVAQHLTVPNIPKLQYRTKSFEAATFHQDDSISSVSPVSTNFSSVSVSTASSSPGASDSGQAQRLAKALYKPLSPIASRSSSASPSPYSSIKETKKSSKKRGSSFFGFLVVKEPSQKALEDYQRHMQKKGVRKDGRINAAGLPGVSSAKLPPSVPKVNSKWDGVPLAIKEKDKRKQSSSRQTVGGGNRSIRTSGSECSTSNISSSSYSRTSSYRSKAGGQQHGSASSLSNIYGWEVAPEFKDSFARNNTEAHDGLKKSSSIDYLDKSILNSLQNAPLTPKIPEEYLKQTLPDIGALLGPNTGEASSIPCSIKPWALPPVTLSSPSNLIDTEPSPVTASPPTSTSLDISETHKILNSEGTHILAPPVGATRRGKTPPVVADEAGKIIMPLDDARLRLASKKETIPRKPSPLARIHLSNNYSNPDWDAMTGIGGATARSNASANDHSLTRTAERQPISQSQRIGFSAKTSHDAEDQQHSPPALDGIHKLRRKTRMALFNK